ncbi:hypothetical protein HK097_004727, partial [Rhizophlyctis rosea]
MLGFSDYTARTIATSLIKRELTLDEVKDKTNSLRVICEQRSFITYYCDDGEKCDYSRGYWRCQRPFPVYGYAIIAIVAVAVVICCILGAIRRKKANAAAAAAAGTVAAAPPVGGVPPQPWQPEQQYAAPPPGQYDPTVAYGPAPGYLPKEDGTYPQQQQYAPPPGSY